MATDPRIETLKHLASIDATLKAILLVLSEQRNDAPADIKVELDGQYGDPVVKAKDPRDWTGAPMKGAKFSECPAEYLELIAERLDFFNSTETDPKKLKYQQLDAARARGWAARIRDGYTPKAVAPLAHDPWAAGEEPPF